MKNLFKRSLAVALALIMCVSMLNLTVFAAQVMTCGKPEHTHTLDCYKEKSELICELEEKDELQEIKTPVIDEETGEETGEYEVSYEVVPGHKHGVECYEAVSELVCGLEEHTHNEDCYDREVEQDEDGNVVPPASFEASTGEGENKQSATVTIGEDGKVTVTVDGKEIEASLSTEKGEAVSENTAATGESTTTSEETSRTTLADGTVVIETTYTTTYTTEVTTGYWVTYTVTYTVPTTYTVQESDDRKVEVGVDENGNVTVTGIKEGATLTLTGDDGKEYTVTQGDDGKYYVTIGDKQYEVQPTIVEDTETQGKYTVSWGFPEDVNPKYTVEVDKDLPDGVKIEDRNVTLSKDVKLDGTEFKVKDGKTYVVDANGDEHEVTLTAEQQADGSYKLSWSYEVTTTVDPGTEVPELPEDVTASVENGTLTIKAGDEVLTNAVTKIDGKTIVSMDSQGKVTCKDDDGNVYIYVIKATEPTGDNTSYTIEYQQVSSVTKTEINETGGTNAINKLGHDSSGYHEFIAIALPDGSYVKVGQGTAGNHQWLVNGTLQNVKVTTEGNTLKISYGNNKSQSYTFDNLEGYDITNVVYESTSNEHSPDGRFDNIIVYIAGIVVEDEFGNVQTLTLTAKDDGSLGTTTKTINGDATVGGKENKEIDVTKLDGSDIVIVETAGGEEVEMTYSEYLEAKDKGEDVKLVAVREDRIDPEPSESSELPQSSQSPEQPSPSPSVEPSEEPSEPVVIEDPDTPLGPLPELPEQPEEPVEIDEPDTPLGPLPELPEQPELPDEVEVEDPDVPLAAVPQTGDNTVLWATTAVASGAGLIWLAVDGKKRREDAE